jgi:hypothetical protein
MRAAKDVLALVARSPERDYSGRGAFVLESVFKRASDDEA